MNSRGEPVDYSRVRPFRFIHLVVAPALDTHALPPPPALRRLNVRMDICRGRGRSTKEARGGSAAPCLLDLPSLPPLSRNARRAVPSGDGRSAPPRGAHLHRTCSAGGPPGLAART